VIFTAVAATGAGRATPVNLWPLDERAAFAVRLSVDAPTTITFPDAVTSLEGANVSARAEDNPAVLLSHQPGANYFSVRALRPDATGAINAIYRGKVIVLTFTTGGDPDRAVTFRETADRAAAGHTTHASPTHWFARLEEAKRYALLAEQYPAVGQRIEHTTPRTVNDCGGFTTIVEDVFRFADDGALVFRLRLENPGNQTVRYAAVRLAVCVARKIFPAALTDASGLVPAKSATVVWVVVGDSPDGASAGLSLKNTFTVDVPRLP